MTKEETSRTAEEWLCGHRLGTEKPPSEQLTDEVELAICETLYSESRPDQPIDEVLRAFRKDQ